MKVVLFVRRSSNLQLSTAGQAAALPKHLLKLREVVVEPIVAVTQSLDREVS